MINISFLGDASLYMSEDKGKTWVKVTNKVRNYFWGRQNIDTKTDLFVERQPGGNIGGKTYIHIDLSPLKEDPDTFLRRI